MVEYRCGGLVSAMVSVSTPNSISSAHDKSRNFRLRYTQPDLIRPIRVPLFFPIIYLIATVFVVVVPMIASPVETGYGLLMILSSIPVYFVLIAWKSKPKGFQQAMGEYSLVLPLQPFLLNRLTYRSFKPKIAKIIDGGSA